MLYNKIDTDPEKQKQTFISELMHMYINEPCPGGLTHYQMTNFRLFQTERVCRRQFQI